MTIHSYLFLNCTNSTYYANTISHNIQRSSSENIFPLFLFNVQTKTTNRSTDNIVISSCVKRLKTLPSLQAVESLFPKYPRRYENYRGITFCKGVRPFNAPAPAAHAVRARPVRHPGRSSHLLFA